MKEMKEKLCIIQDQLADESCIRESTEASLSALRKVMDDSQKSKTKIK